MRLTPYALALPLLAPAGCLENSCADGHCAPHPSTTTTGTATETPTTSNPTGATDSTAGGTDSTGGAGSTGDTGGAEALPSKYANGCAPNDGPAVDFNVGLDLRTCEGVPPEDAPILIISIYQGVDLPLGTHMIGAAYLDTGNGMPQTSNTGSLTVTEKTADGLLGTYDVTFPDNTHLTGSFDAIFCIVDILCG